MYIEQKSPKQSNEIVLTILRFINLVAVIVNLGIAVYWSINLSQLFSINGFGVVFILIHITLCSWSLAYILNHGLAANKTFRFISILSSSFNILLTVYWVILIITDSEYGLYAVLWLFYFGFLETIVSGTLLVCLLFESAESKRMQKRLVQHENQNVIYYIPYTSNQNLLV